MIVEAKINKIHVGHTNVKAYATLTIDNAVAIHSVCIVETYEGLKMSMPAFERRQYDGNTKLVQICHPISFSARRKMEEILFEAYNAKLEENKSN